VSSSGKTLDFDSSIGGSNPSTPATTFLNYSNKLKDWNLGCGVECGVECGVVFLNFIFGLDLM
jgi:hypothetical protein